MHYSLSTEKVYLYWVRFFIRWHGRNGTSRHPREMGSVEVEAFLAMLASMEGGTALLALVGTGMRLMEGVRLARRLADTALLLSVKSAPRRPTSRFKRGRHCCRM